MRTVVINHKRYTVQCVFIGVANYYFTDKHGVAHLVDAEDVAEWADDGENDINNAIAYAREIAANTEDGNFWWKTLTPEEVAIRRDI